MDLRVLGPAVTGWLCALAVLAGGGWWVAAALVAAGAAVPLLLRRRVLVTAAGWLLAGAACAAGAQLQLTAVASSGLEELAATEPSATVEVTLTGTPTAVRSRFSQGSYVAGRARLVLARGRRLRVDAPVLVLLRSDAKGLDRGATIRIDGRLRPGDRPDRAAVVDGRGPPVVLSRPNLVARATARVRAAIRLAAAPGSGNGSVLVPALVDGDDGGLPDTITADFATTGLTHLVAVSGTNLTLVVGFLLVVARWAGVRTYGLVAVGGIGVVGFVELAGPEPSVLRAAAMGTVTLIGISSGGRDRGIRALGVGVLALVLLDPWLSRSVGFALSVTATAGILLLVPRWRGALARWLPRWAAEALAVPLAAQLACTPLVAAVSGQVSLVAVAANLLAAPLVAPATVLGLVGGLVAMVAPAAGQLLATPAVWCADGIVAVARTGAALPLPAVGWSTGPWALGLLVVLCAGSAVLVPVVLRSRSATLLAAGVLAVVVLVPLPTPGWPPPGWVLVACSVGQGDGLVLRVGTTSAVVVDAGPDPRSMDRCLRRLGIRVVPVVVLTHFHADHVDGLPGVLHGRRVGLVVTSPLADPTAGAAGVRRTAARAGVPVRTVTAGESTTVGPVRWQVLAPTRTDFADSESPPNDASVVLLVRTRGISILMMGDEERPSQQLLRRSVSGLRADVLKVAHHGSSKQDPALIADLGARVALISVGADNDYGHPAGSTLGLLQRAGLQVRRTDQDGDVAVVVDGDGHLGTVSRAVGRP
ncbi:MAG: ComEC/Rec2 family competence protein [Marmoricola sp.]